MFLKSFIFYFNSWTYLIRNEIKLQPLGKKWHGSNASPNHHTSTAMLSRFALIFVLLSLVNAGVAEHNDQDLIKGIWSNQF